MGDQRKVYHKSRLDESYELWLVITKQDQRTMDAVVIFTFEKILFMRIGMFAQECRIRYCVFNTHYTNVYIA